MYEGILVSSVYRPQSVVMLATKIAITGIDFAKLHHGTETLCIRNQKLVLVCGKESSVTELKIAIYGGTAWQHISKQKVL